MSCLGRWYTVAPAGSAAGRGRGLLLYYGDQSYFLGTAVLGRMDGDAAQRIAEMNGSVTAIVEAG